MPSVLHQVAHSLLHPFHLPPAHILLLFLPPLPSAPIGPALDLTDNACRFKDGRTASRLGQLTILSRTTNRMVQGWEDWKPRGGTTDSFFLFAGQLVQATLLSTPQVLPPVAPRCKSSVIPVPGPGFLHIAAASERVCSSAEQALRSSWGTRPTQATVSRAYPSGAAYRMMLVRRV
jgi:hypothetical protein